MRQKVLVSICILLVLLVASQCRKSDTTQFGKNTLTFLLPRGNEKIITPIWVQEPMFLVFLPLSVWNNEGRLDGVLAESWEPSEDFKTWTVRLRKGIQWHDGEPVTAHDAKFTFDRFVNGWPLEKPMPSRSIEILDDYTYTITFHKHTMFSSTPVRPWTVLLPKHLLEPIVDSLDHKDYKNWEFWSRPVGNGPYRYLRHVPNTMVELEANPDFYQGKPAIERIILRFGGSPILELQAGNVDVARLNPIESTKLASDPRFASYYMIGILPGSGSSGSIVWNQNSPFFAEKDVRKAMTLAINRRELHRVLNFPDNLPIYDTVFTSKQFWENDFPEPLPYDPDLARELLDRAGWKDSDGDGIRDKDGLTFRFKADVLDAREHSQDEVKTAIYLQSELKRVGVQMDIHTRAEAAGPSKNWDALILRYWNDLYSSPRGLFQNNSFSGYRNPRVINIMDKLLQTFNPQEKESLFAELQPLIQEDLPVTFLHPILHFVIANTRIKGYINPLENYPIALAPTLWIDK